MKTFRWLTLAAVLLGCADGVSPTVQLQKAIQRWEDAAVSSYSMRVRFVCGECSADVRRQVIVTVQNGVVETRVFADNGATVGQELESVWPMVDGLFTKILDLISDNAYRLDVRYNPTLGYPESISTDPIKNAVDDEHGWVVTDLVVNP